LADQQICKAIPELQYAVKWKRPFYGLGGADFDSPPPLGETDRSR
jgi:hypothetical protein